MRRMHGTLVEPVVDDEGTFQTPASTTFVKSVRSFRGLRFTRAAHEGKKTPQLILELVLHLLYLPKTLHLYLCFCPTDGAARIFVRDFLPQ